MKDGQTRPLVQHDVDDALFLAHHRVTLVVIEGVAAGSEYEITGDSAVVGRYSGTDICLADDSVSGVHAAIELGAGGFKVRDMGSTNGTFLNGKQVQNAELEHGDRIGIGEHVLQYLQEKKERTGSYDLSDEAD
jgi:pSer/pThr/pTyr-binding forkhead associated (FHA) protein